MGVYSLTKSSIKNWVKYPNMMAGSAYIDPASDFLITETVLNSNTASVTFDVSTLAAAGYKHLQIRAVTKNSFGSAKDIRIRFNGDTATNYSIHQIYPSSGSLYASATTSTTSAWSGHSNGTDLASTIFNAAIIDLVDFSSTSKNKTLRSLSGEPAVGYILFRSSAWNSTAAITSINLFPDSSVNFTAGSRFSLYASKG